MVVPENELPGEANEAGVAGLGVEESDAHEHAYPKGIKLALIMAALLVTECLVGIDQTVVATATASVGNDFHSLKTVGWYGSAYLLTSCTLQPLYGRLYGYFPQKWVFLSALSTFQIASVVSAVAHSNSVFVFGRALQGCGYAGIFIGCLSISTASLPMHLQAVFVSLMGAAYGIGAALGPLIGGILTSNLSWRWCFWINLPPGGLALFIVVFLCNPPIKKQELPVVQRLYKITFDAIGALFLTAGTTCLLLVLQDGGISKPWNSSLIIGLIVGFVLLIGAFFALQVYLKEDASLSMRVLKNRSIICLWILNATVGATYYSILYAEPLYFQAVRGSSAQTSGVQCLATIIPLVISGIVVGWTISYLRSYHAQMVVGTVFSSVGSGLLATFNESTAVGKWIGIQVIVGLGLGTAYMLAFIASQAILPPKDRQAGASLVVFMQLFGATIWVSASQAIYQNGLLTRIRGIPGIDIASVVDSGVSEFRRVVPVDLLPLVIRAASDSLFDVFIAVCVIAAVGVPAIVGIKRVRIE